MTIPSKLTLAAARINLLQERHYVLIKHVLTQSVIVVRLNCTKHERYRCAKIKKKQNVIKHSCDLLGIFACFCANLVAVFPKCDELSD